MSDGLKVFPLPFPARGVHESSAISEQPEGTSPRAINVRSYDLVARRDRGCQRSGMFRLPNVVNATGPIDLIKSAMLGQTSATVGGSSYTYSAATMISAGAGNHIVSSATNIGLYYSAAYQRFNVTSSHTAMPTGGLAGASALFTPGFIGFSTGTPLDFTGVINYTGGTVVGRATFSPGNGTYYVRVSFFADHVLLEVSSNHGSVTNSYAITSIPVSSFHFDIQIGLTGILCLNGATTCLNHTYTAGEQALINDIFNVGISSIAYGTPIVEASCTTATPGSDLYSGISITAIAGTNADPLSEQIIYLQKDSGVKGVVTVGTIVGGFTQITSGLTDGCYSTISQIDVVPAYGKFWLVDGVHALRSIDPATADFQYPAATHGTLPALSRILALYRGRLWHGGILTDPYNFFSSRSGDPLDYDYAQLDAAGAIAGNATLSAGLLGDYLTAMIPFGDVSMLMGMGSSIAVMRGDPKAGGDIALLSREIGVASLNAWCRAPDGSVYFMARDGLYRIASGNLSNPPQPISRGRLDNTLGHIDFTQFRVLMCWDPLELGVKIVLSPVNATLDTTVVFWGQRKNDFWVDTIPAAIAPRAVCPLRGSGGPGGIMLYGGYDGWIRYMSPLALSDDGTAVSSLVRYPPVVAFGENVDSKLVGLRQLLGNEAGVPFRMVYGVLAGNDPVSAGAQTSYDQSGTITAGGYQSILNQRSRGNTFILELSNAVAEKTWQVEQTTLLLRPSGRQRA